MALCSCSWVAWHPLPTDCPTGTYSGLSGAASVGSCFACPSGTSTAATGSTDISQCLCNQGTVGTITNSASTCARKACKVLMDPAVHDH